MKILLAISLLALSLYSNDFVDDKKDYQEELYKEPISPKGYIFENFQVTLMYGGESSSLSIDSQIEHIGGEGEESYELTDGGEFIFDEINTNYKKMRFQLLNDISLSYTVQGTDVKLDTAPWEAPKLDIPENGEDVFFLAKQIIGGYGEIDYTNSLLGHESKYSLLYREAKFEGLYKRGDVTSYLEMDKDQYGAKIILNARGNNRFGVFNYWKLLYESSVFPQVIFIEGANFDELDEKFTSDKYTIAQGIDYVLPGGLIYGYEMGLGYSAVSPSKSMLNKLDQRGYDNIDTSIIHLFGALNLGYQYRGLFDYTALSLDLLYNAQFLYESSSEPDEKNDPTKLYLTYQRTEIVHNIKYALTWSF